jgi:hypothetical protein
MSGELMVISDLLHAAEPAPAVHSPMRSLLSWRAGAGTAAQRAEQRALAALISDMPFDAAAAALGQRLAPLLRAALAGSVTDCADEAMAEAAAAGEDCSGVQALTAA